MLPQPLQDPFPTTAHGNPPNVWPDDFFQCLAPRTAQDVYVPTVATPIAGRHLSEWGLQKPEPPLVGAPRAVLKHDRLHSQLAGDLVGVRRGNVPLRPICSWLSNLCLFVINLFEKILKNFCFHYVKYFLDFIRKWFNFSKNVWNCCYSRYQTVKTAVKIIKNTFFKELDHFLWNFFNSKNLQHIQIWLQWLT